MTVVTLGVHIVDVLARPVESIPDGQDTHLLEQIRITAAGAAAGTAVDLAKLGAESSPMGAVGDDELGDFLLMVMARHGVDVAGDRPQGRRADRGLDPAHPPRRRAPVLPRPRRQPGPVPRRPGPSSASWRREVVHLGGMDVTWGCTTRRSSRCWTSARRGGTVVTMDLLSNMPDLMQGARALPAARRLPPAQRGAGAPDERRERGRGGGDAPCWREGPAAVLVTLGGEGSLVATASGITRVPALDVPVVDTTGCGDAYCAGFIAGLVDGREVVGAARLGTARGRPRRRAASARTPGLDGAARKPVRDTGLKERTYVQRRRTSGSGPPRSCPAACTAISTRPCTAPATRSSSWGARAAASATPTAASTSTSCAPGAPS